MLIQCSAKRFFIFFNSHMEKQSSDALPQNSLSSIWESAVNARTFEPMGQSPPFCIATITQLHHLAFHPHISPYRKSVWRASSSDSLIHYHPQVCVFKQEWFTLHSWKCNGCKNVLKIELALAGRSNKINTKSKINFVETHSALWLSHF